MKGSGPVLAGCVLAFLAAFFGLRGCSVFLRVEREAPALRELARAHGLDLATVLALREQAPGLPPAAFAARVSAFGRCRTDLGDELAAVAVAGGEAAARRALAAARGDRAAAFEALRREPVGMPGVRFQLLRARFAGRGAAAGGD